MLTLGINAAFHDSSACIVRDGVLVAAVEEERFNRVKHAKRPVPFSAWELPYHAIDYCLAAARASLADVDHVAYALDPQLLPGAADAGERIELPLEPSAVLRRDPDQGPWDALFRCYVINAPRQLAGGAPHHLARRFAGVSHDGPFRWHWVPHHLAHEASAFLAAPFERCAVMTLDGRGERATTTHGLFVGGAYRRLKQVDFPHSLGLLYEAVTRHLGFLHSSDEYKVMALASYGTPRHAAAFREMVRLDGEGGYTVERCNLAERFGPARKRGEPFTREHQDIAASLQCVLEESVLALAAWLARATREQDLAMAGGVALNCVMNARLRDAGSFARVWVQPAAGDAGTALGAALWVDYSLRSGALAAIGDPGETQANAGPSSLAAAGSASAVPAATAELAVQLPAAAAIASAEPTSGAERAGPAQAHHVPRFASARPAVRGWVMTHAFLGPEYGDDEIERLLRWTGITYRRPPDIGVAAAELLVAGRILGWFQGRMEFGPRALGARSIIASPIEASMQARLNELKDREDFRPVAPVVLEECLGDWFEPAGANDGESPFMLFVYRVRAERADRIAAVRHVDGSARVQTIRREQNPRYYDVIRAFGARTGVPVLINTSFNTRGEPIVCTPRDALESFWTTPLDALAIGPFLVEKTR